MRRACTASQHRGESQDQNEQFKCWFAGLEDGKLSPGERGAFMEPSRDLFTLMHVINANSCISCMGAASFHSASECTVVQSPGSSAASTSHCRCSHLFIYSFIFEPLTASLTISLVIAPPQNSALALNAVTQAIAPWKLDSTF